MPLERAAAVLEQIEPDEAADMLGELPDDARRRSSSRACRHEREEDLRELASHPEHTAGSLMTTDFVDLPVALDRRRRARVDPRASGPSTHAMTYLYFVDDGRAAWPASPACATWSWPSRPSRVAELMEDDVVDDHGRRWTKKRSAAS